MKYFVLIIAILRFIYGLYYRRYSIFFSNIWLAFGLIDLLAYILANTLLIIIFIFIIVDILFDIYFISGEDKDTSCKYLLVLGNELNNNEISSILKYRLDKTIEYCKDNNPIIILCGGKTNNNTLSEANVMRKYLKKNGLKNKMLLEDKSKTTIENIKNAINKYPDIINESVTVLSSNYHVARAKLICRKVGIKNIKGITCKTPLNLLPQQLFKERFALIKNK